MANNITDEEITRLAREYAEEVTKADIGDPDLPDSELEDIREAVSDYAEDVLKWLLRSHCLVEKSRVLKIYHGNENTKRYTSDPIIGAMSCAENTLLETLFGDTLKEEGGENGED